VPVAAPVAAVPEAAPAPSLGADWTAWGAPFAVDAVTPVSDFFKDPASFTGKTVRLSGPVVDVCQKAGCWMVLADGANTMRVTVKEHGFAVAKDGAGALCEAEGTVVAEVVPKETVAHFAGESANAAAIPEKAGQTSYSLVATAVRMKRSG
jgi:hypothetical protein